MAEVKSPWKPIRQAVPHSLSTIEREQRVEGDLQEAIRLQVHETDAHEALVVDPVQQEQTFEDDFAYALHLQELENQAAAAAGSKPADENDTSEDHALAMALQAEMNAVHDRAISDREAIANNFGRSKVRISMDQFRTYPSEQREAGHEVSFEEEADHWDDEIEIPTTYHRGTRTFRDDEGNIITKHNPTVEGRRNRQKMEHSFPLGFNSGDLKGSRHDDMKIGSKVYNHLRRFAQKNQKQHARLHEKKENSTAVMAMDKKTRLLVFKLVNRGILEQVNGAVSSGKESVIFHGNALSDVEDPDSPVVECALKVFKTTLTEFTQRQQFLNGDRRFEGRTGKQHARKLIKLWAEKEMANLHRMSKAGILCPKVILQRQHVLVMSFIGEQGRAAPKLKDVQWSQKRLGTCYEDVLRAMTVMYQECRLVHCDLSEYNILYHEKKPWLIDVGQAVELNHPRSHEYLFRDCVNIHSFFEKSGCRNLASPADMFMTITGSAMSAENQIDFRNRITCEGKGVVSRHDRVMDMLEETSNVVLQSEGGDAAEMIAHPEIEDGSDSDIEDYGELEEMPDDDLNLALEAALRLNATVDPNFQHLLDDALEEDADVDDVEQDTDPFLKS